MFQIETRLIRLAGEIADIDPEEVGDHRHRFVFRESDCAGGGFIARIEPSAYVFLMEP